MPPTNLALLIAYDGTCFSGWQNNGRARSVELEISTILQQVLQQPIKLQAASRTDAGVHAEGQVVQFCCYNPPSSLKKSLAALLPKDISVLDLWTAKEDFHPTLHCKKKEYHYNLCYAEEHLPSRRFFEWHYPSLLQLEKIERAASSLQGVHSFKAFCNQRKNLCYSSYERELYRVEVIAMAGKRLRFEIEGDRFLYKMARNIVGTLVWIGCGKMSLDQLSLLFKTQDRRLGAVTAPAHGLTLKKVTYG